jgi:hypothetical protein
MNRCDNCERVNQLETENVSLREDAAAKAIAHEHVMAGMRKRVAELEGRRCETCADAAELRDISVIECQSTVPDCPVRWMELPIGFGCTCWKKGGCGDE